MLLKLFVAPVLVLSFSLAARRHDAKDGDAIQGTWLPSAAEFAGKKFPDEVRKTIKLVVKGDKYTVTVGTEGRSGNPQAEPVGEAEGAGHHRHRRPEQGQDDPGHLRTGRRHVAGLLRPPWQEPSHGVQDQGGHATVPRHLQARETLTRLAVPVVEGIISDSSKIRTGRPFIQPRTNVACASKTCLLHPLALFLCAFAAALLCSVLKAPELPRRYSCIRGRPSHRAQDKTCRSFSKLFKLFRHFIHLRKRDPRSNVVLEEFLKLLPFGCAHRPGGTMDKLSQLRQGIMNAAFCLVPLSHVRVQGMYFFFRRQHLPRRGFHFCP